MNGREKLVPIAHATSIHQRTHATVTKLSPHAGTQTNVIMLMMVASPMGNVPRNKDCTGWRIMQDHIPRKRVYLKIEMAKNKTNRTTLTAKIATEIQYSHRALYGRLWSRIDTIPVPMLTLNHDGVKFNTIRRQPVRFCCNLEWFAMA